MSIDLDSLKADRREWVASSKKNRFEDGIKRLLTELYPDNAHFIFELLQNAEDAKASVVRFTLSNDGLDFEHDGSRLFTLDDVNSITSIGDTKKRDDPTSIGKFGVGFKAVFAYTTTPEVHSGKFSFRIEELVIPETSGVKRPRMEEKETKFLFPFNHAKKKADKAVAEVERALRELGDSTLLFLTNIRKIEYLLPDGELGSLERLDPAPDRIEIRARHPGGKQKSSHWLRFSSDVCVVDDDGKDKECRIAIAFSIVEEPKKAGEGTSWKIEALEQGLVSIFFPAEKETSNLRFHLHAPFASTVARDSVRDSKANEELRDHLAVLAVSSLAEIRDQGLLTVDFLSVLPNSLDGLTEFYEPIRLAIIEAFNEQELTPTRMASHAAASKLFRGPAAISRVLNDNVLARLLGEPYTPPIWAANAQQENQREDRFLESLDSKSWGWFHAAHLIASCNVEEKSRGRLQDWIAEQSDANLLSFYALLGAVIERTGSSINVTNVRIVRVAGKHKDEHIVPGLAHFPSDSGTKVPKDVRFVKLAVYGAGRSEAQKRQAESFLKSIGVRHYDETEKIKRLLRRYESNESITVDKSYYADIERFISFLKKSHLWMPLFKKPAFLIAQDIKGALSRKPPSAFCLDTPFLETGLNELRDIHGKVSLYSEYQSNLNESANKEFVSFLQNLGVMYQLTVERVSTEYNPAKNELWTDYRQSGVRWTQTGRDEDYTIPNLHSYLKKKSIAASRLVWMALIHANKDAAKAWFRPNQTYQLRFAESHLVYYSKAASWIPDRDGVFHKPQDIVLDALHGDFPYDERNGLLAAIGLGENARKQNQQYRAKNELAQSLGLPSVEIAEKIGRLLKNGLTIEECEAIVTQRQRASLPEQPVPNPERRRQGVLEKRDNAPSKESIVRERSILPHAPEETIEAKAYLRAKYTNADGHLICQCCRHEMPFKIRGEYYFEAMQSVRGLNKHHPEVRLALCPTCAAKYQHARDTNDQEMRARILGVDAPDTAPSVEVAVRLAGSDYQLHFVGTHWFDLKVVLAGNE